MSNLPRMRTVRECLKQLHEDDPDTAISEHFVRRLAKTGKIPTLFAGNRTLLNYDALCDFLAEGEPAQQNAERKYGEIRQVHQ